jgi:amino acid transporter, AAT family
VGLVLGSAAFSLLGACAVQGWSSIIPRFSAVDFVSFYIELFVMGFMYLLWLLVRRALPLHAPSTSSSTPTHPARRPFFDFVDVTHVDLYDDEHEEVQRDKHEDEVRVHRLRGRTGWAWALYYYLVA